jgi:cytoskeletal protein RodZ
MFAVPIAIIVLWLASLSAQVGVVWPNYEAEQKKAEQAEKGASEEKSKKAKSEQGKKPASKNKTHEDSGGADGTP